MSDNVSSPGEAPAESEQADGESPNAESEPAEEAQVLSEKIWQPILGSLMVFFFAKIQSCTR